jgi:hypothetical protein
MSVQFLDQKLLEKLANKTKMSIKYLREQITKKASRSHVSSQAYFVYWLKQEGIGAENYRKKLPSDIKTEILELSKSNTLETKPKVVASKSTNSQKVLHIENIKIVEKPPLLDQHTIEQAQQNSSLYPLIYILENSIRKLINHLMLKNFGSNWWEEKISNATKQSVETKKRKDTLNPWMGKRSEDPIYYTDFIDLANIIRSKPDIFNKIFEGLSGGTNWIIQRIEELYLIRNNIAHSCPLSKKDRTLLNAYFKTIYDTLDTMNSKIA